jgi:hypothetical protein
MGYDIELTQRGDVTHWAISYNDCIMAQGDDAPDYAGAAVLYALERLETQFADDDTSTGS